MLQMMVYIQNNYDNTLLNKPKTKLILIKVK